uniref:NEDD4 binding protein 2 n=1 Tax=Gasterosteus aculeatus aculeatus TaxID=481459 RepID=A0AAQ4PAU8_GASAC
MTETAEDQLKPPLDLATSGRPSAFQRYKKQQDVSRALLDETTVAPSEGVVGGARAKTNPLTQQTLGNHNPGGVALSTDDYFSRNGVYQYDPAALGEAHEWNHKQAKEAFDRGANPIIIDNTNMQGWEMKPYVAQALKHGYKVLFREPDTWWKNKPRELERRNSHNVPVERIRRMLDNYERFVTVQSIMGSRMPETKPRLHLENSSSHNQLCVTEIYMITETF